MPDPLAGLGEDVPPPMGTNEAMSLILELIRDTMLVPKPISRDQAAMHFMAAILSISNKDDPEVERLSLKNDMDDVAYMAVVAADALFEALEKSRST